MISHIFSSTSVAMFRTHISSLSLMALRSLLLKTLEFVTNLGSLSAHYLEVGTPSLTLIQTAVVDLIYGSSRRRPGNLFVCYFLTI